MVKVGDHQPIDQPAPPSKEPSKPTPHPLTDKMKEALPKEGNSPVNILKSKDIKVGAQDVTAVRTKFIPIGKPIEEAGSDVFGLESLRFLFAEKQDVKTISDATARIRELVDHAFDNERPEKFKTQTLFVQNRNDGVHLEGLTLDNMHAVSNLKQQILHDPTTGKVTVPKSLFSEYGNFLLRMVEAHCEEHDIPTDQAFASGVSQLPSLHLEVIDPIAQEAFENVLTHEVENHVMERAALQQTKQKEAAVEEKLERAPSMPAKPVPSKQALKEETLNAEVKKEGQPESHESRKETVIAKRDVEAYQREAKAMKERNKDLQQASDTREKEQRKSEKRLGNL